MRYLWESRTTFSNLQNHIVIVCLIFSVRAGLLTLHMDLWGLSSLKERGQHNSQWWSWKNLHLCYREKSIQITFSPLVVSAAQTLTKFRALTFCLSVGGNRQTHQYLGSCKIPVNILRDKSLKTNYTLHTVRTSGGMLAALLCFSARVLKTLSVSDVFQRARQSLCCDPLWAEKHCWAHISSAF